MKRDTLTDREETVLRAVVDAYIDSAEPAGSRRIVRQYELDVSPATVRNTMADLEAEGLSDAPAHLGRSGCPRTWRTGTTWTS